MTQSTTPVPGWLNTEEPGRGQPFPPGRHTGKITKVITTNNEGAPLLSTRGMPQFAVIISDNNGHEARYQVTVTDEKLEFPERSLGKLVKAAGFDLEAMKAGNVTTGHFLDEIFVRRVFLGKTRTVTLDAMKPREVGDKTYVDIELVANPAAQAVANQAAAATTATVKPAAQAVAAPDQAAPPATAATPPPAAPPAPATAPPTADPAAQAVAAQAKDLF